MYSVHRVLLAALLVGNAVVFAGVDSPIKLLSAAIVLVLMIDLRRVPEVPSVVRAATWSFLALAVVQLLPLPEGLRRLLQPGFVEVMAAGWAPLSLAPWSTIQVVASMVVVAGVALTAARMASTCIGNQQNLISSRVCVVEKSAETCIQGSIGKSHYCDRRIRTLNSAVVNA